MKSSVMPWAIVAGLMAAGYGNAYTGPEEIRGRTCVVAEKEDRAVTVEVCVEARIRKETKNRDMLILQDARNSLERFAGDLAARGFTIDIR